MGNSTCICNMILLLSSFLLFSFLEQVISKKDVIEREVLSKSQKWVYLLEITLRYDSNNDPNQQQTTATTTNDIDQLSSFLSKDHSRELIFVNEMDTLVWDNRLINITIPALFHINHWFKRHPVSYIIPTYLPIFRSWYRFHALIYAHSLLIYSPFYFIIGSSGWMSSSRIPTSCSIYWSSI